MKKVLLLLLVLPFFFLSGCLAPASLNDVFFGEITEMSYQISKEVPLDQPNKIKETRYLLIKAVISNKAKRALQAFDIACPEEKNISRLFTCDPRFQKLKKGQIVIIRSFPSGDCLLNQTVYAFPLRGGIPVITGMEIIE